MAFTIGPSKPGQLVPQMNVTPLVDVVLVLLIIFMVVTPLLTKQAWMNVPPVAKDELVAPSDGPPPVVVTVDAAGAVKLNGDAVSRGALASTVQGMLNARADKVVFFDAASDAPYATAVEVLDLLKASGAGTIAVLADALPH